MQGCVNDITAIQEYLKKRVNTDRYQLYPPLTLLNKDATRQAIIDGLRQHLCQAGSKDVVLFYFCGHGAREKAGEEFKDWELDNAHETIVCYDSRSMTNGKKVPDLADKELRYLISQVANKGENSPDHVLVDMELAVYPEGSKYEDFEISAEKENASEPKPIKAGSVKAGQTGFDQMIAKICGIVEVEQAKRDRQKETADKIRDALDNELHHC